MALFVPVTFVTCHKTVEQTDSQYNQTYNNANVVRHYFQKQTKCKFESLQNLLHRISALTFEVKRGSGPSGI